MRKTTSAFSRLKVLGEVFDIRDVEKTFVMPRKDAIVYCTRWKQAGMISPAGEKLGVFYNLVRDPEGPDYRKAEAINKAIRVPAVLVGGAVLFEAGWTTQKYQHFDIAIPVSRAKPSIPNFFHNVRSVPRYTRWHSNLMETASVGQQNLLSVSPAMALADLLLAEHREINGYLNVTVYSYDDDGKPTSKQKEKLWIPAPSDIEFPEEDDLEEVQDCLRYLGASEEEIEEITVPFGAEFENDGSSMSRYV